jgi:hypothetical protein
MTAVRKGKTPDEEIAENTAEMKKLLQKIAHENTGLV